MSPLYSYRCVCGNEEEHLVAIVDRDELRLFCNKCGQKLQRTIDAPKLQGEAYQMKAVLGNGSHVKGHFGKMAKIPRKK